MAPTTPYLLTTGMKPERAFLVDAFVVEVLKPPTVQGANPNTHMSRLSFSRPINGRTNMGAKIRSGLFPLYFSKMRMCSMIQGGKKRKGKKKVKKNKEKKTCGVEPVVWGLHKDVK